MKSTNGFPIKGNNDDGDSMLWAGLTVASGNNIPIVGIKQCQTPDGRLWRSPARVNNQSENSFSRDMSLGFILYFQATQDHEMADKWIAYIKKTKGLFPASESSDTRHLVTPTLWWMMSYAGMKVPLIYRLTRGFYKTYTSLELLFTPSGYERHLKAVSELVLAIRDKKRDTVFGNKLLASDPYNPFFAWLAGVDDAVILDRAQSMHEAARSSDNGDGTYGSGNQWAWERADHEGAYMDSMGWDFEFIYNLLKRKDIK